ncbi:hypothetical protein [Mesorhizobium sp. M1027]|uniref:hypothetical protein n=1 Tax=Mesorhizobium sp. M1027 TaxID=2957050 RepID=UPI00333A1E41
MSDDMVFKGPAESWVEQLEIPAADPARSDQIKNGVSWLLSDDQIKHRAGGYVEYSRTVYKIVDRPGLDVARVSICSSIRPGTRSRSTIFTSSAMAPFWTGWKASNSTSSAGKETPRKASSTAG